MSSWEEIRAINRLSMHYNIAGTEEYVKVYEWSVSRILDGLSLLIF